GGLAGAVGADDGEDLALVDVERHVRHGREAAEALGEAAHAEDGGGHGFASVEAEGGSPLGSGVPSRVPVVAPAPLEPRPVRRRPMPVRSPTRPRGMNRIEATRTMP